MAFYVLLAVFGLHGIVVKCTATILFHTVDLQSGNQQSWLAIVHSSISTKEPSVCFLPLKRFIINLSTPKIKEQILISCSHTSLNKTTGERFMNYREKSHWVIISLILHELRGWISIDITRKNLMLISVRD